MTTIAAVKKGNKLCLASDTLMTLGNRKEVADQHVSNKGKIIQIGPNYLGSSGHASWGLVLSHYFSKKKVPEWKTEKEIFEVFTLMHEELKEKYFLHPPTLSYLPFESSEFCFLIINRHGIFEIEYSRAVRKYSRFSAIGTGEEYALGAIQAVYDQFEDPEEIAKIGVQAGVHFDRQSELPIQICCIDLRVGQDSGANVQTSLKSEA